MVENLGKFRSLVIKETLTANGGKGVEVVDLGRKNTPNTWIRFRRGKLFILGEDRNWYEIDKEHAFKFWQAREVERMVVPGVT